MDNKTSNNKEIEYEKCLLVMYGEVALRGRNKNIFLRQMMEDIREKLGRESGYLVEGEQGRFLVRGESKDFDPHLIADDVRTVFGVLNVCPCIRSKNRDIEVIEKLAVSLMENKKGSFKVETNRADKNYPIESPQVSGFVGSAIQKAYGQPVSMTENEHTLYIEIRSYVYVYEEILEGIGGLPYNTSGSALSLLSGGIDSPVATFLTARRGIAMEGVYFHSPPFTSERALLKVEDLAKQLAYYTGEFRLHIINFTDTQILLRDNAPMKRLTLLLKRSMLSIADHIAKEENIDALVTGDSIGQVASQTMQSLVACDSATDMMVIRPLATFDKQSVVDLAIEIGTYDISIRPYDDCCTLFVAENPETKPKRHVIESLEENIHGLPKAWEEAIKTREIKTFTYTK